MTVQDTGKPGLFVRRSSGLVREFGMSDVAVINLVGVNLGIVAALSIAALAGLWPGASMILVVVIGAAISLATVITYGLLSAAMPRAGGDYVFVSRGLTPVLGFLANWMITFSLFVLLGLFSVGLVTQALAPGLAALGVTSESSSLVNAATDLTEDKGLIALVAIAAMLLAVAVAWAGDRAVKYAFRTLAAVGVFGIVVAIVSLFANGSSGFTENINDALTFTGGGSLADIRAAADEAGFEPVGFSLGATLSALPYAFYAFVGLTYTSYLGGEIQRPQRSQPMGMLIALATSLLLYVLLFAGVYSAMGWDSIHAWSFVGGADPDALTFFGGAPLGSFLIAAGSGSPVISVILLASFLAWFFLILLFAVVLPIRNLFAWSMDRVLPEAVSRVSPRGVPYVATAIIALVAIGMVFIAVYSDFISLVVNYTLLYSTTFLLAGIAAMAFPYRRPDLFERAPASVRRRVGGIPLVSLAGAVQTVVFGVIIYYALKTPAFGGPTGRNALLLIGGLLLAAPVVFTISRAIRSRQGYDMDATYQALPPD
jgi:APA family basic amino acid/polyamine antiporter